MSDTNKINDLFVTASRKKFRFSSEVGMLSDEDLWDIPLVSRNPKATSLDSIARAISANLRAESEESFVRPKESAKETELTQMLDIVKFVIETKIAEDKKRTEAAAKREQKRKLLDILAQKQDSELGNKTVEELEAMINDLDV